jgi:hypothetical protein
MKDINIDLKKLKSTSKQPKEFSESLESDNKGGKKKRSFAKTFGATGTKPKERLAIDTDS